MSEIYILIEYRQNEIRDISFELLACGRKLAEEHNSTVTAVILGYNTEKIVEKIESQAHKVLVVDNEVFKEFNAETYQIALADLIQKDSPFLFLIGLGIILWPTRSKRALLLILIVSAWVVSVVYVVFSKAFNVVFP